MRNSSLTPLLAAALFTLYIGTGCTSADDQIIDEASVDSVSEQPTQVPETDIAPEETPDESAEPTDPINLIRADYNHIEGNLAIYTERTAQIEDEDTYEPTQITGYYTIEGDLQKVVSEEIWGHGARKTSYYLKDGALFFAFRQESEEHSVMGPFTDRENRIYFEAGTIIRVLEKEETLDTFEDIDLSDVDNVDITAESDLPALGTELQENVLAWQIALMNTGNMGE